MGTIASTPIAETACTLRQRRIQQEQASTPYAPLTKFHACITASAAAHRVQTARCRILPEDWILGQKGDEC